MHEPCAAENSLGRFGRGCSGRGEHFSGRVAQNWCAQLAWISYLLTTHFTYFATLLDHPYVRALLATLFTRSRSNSRMECGECADDAASEQFAKLVRKLSVCEEEDRTERRAFLSRHAAQAGTTVAATLAQLQEAGVLSQEQVVVAVPPHWPACSLLCHQCAGGGVGWPRSGGSGARDSACTGRDASR